MRSPKPEHHESEIHIFRAGCIEASFLITKSRLIESMKSNGMSFEEKGTKSFVARRLGRNAAQVGRALVNDYKTERGHLLGGFSFLISVSTDHEMPLELPDPKLVRLMGAWNLLSPKNRLSPLEMYYLLLRAGSRYDRALRRAENDHLVAGQQVILPKMREVALRLNPECPLTKLPNDLWPQFRLPLQRALALVDKSFDGDQEKLVTTADVLAETLEKHIEMIAAIEIEWTGSKAIRHQKQRQSFNVDWTSQLWRIAATIIISVGALSLGDGKGTGEAKGTAKDPVLPSPSQTVQIFRTTGEPGAEKHTKPGTFQTVVGKPAPKTEIVEYVVPQGYEPANVVASIHGDGRENRWEWTDTSRLDEKGQKIHTLKLRVRASTTDEGRVTIHAAYAKLIDSPKTVETSFWSNLIGFWW